MAGDRDLDEENTHDPGVDLVAEPVRYPRSPLVALLALAVLPAVGFLALHRWAEGEADSYEASAGSLELFEEELDAGIAGVDDDEAAGVDDESGDETVEETLTPDAALFDLRRAPRLVSEAASTRRLADAVEPVFGFVGDTSCAAVSVDGTVVSELNAGLPVVPASNQKLFVAVAALDVLGPDHRFTTSVAVPPMVDGEVDGDVYLIGGGDPLLTSGDFPTEEDPQPVIAATPFEALADQLVEAGVTRIRGTVIGDGTRYDDEWFVEEWAPGIAEVEAGPYDALLANDARVLGRSGVQDDPNVAAAREFVRLVNDRGIRVDNGWGSGVASTLVPIVASVESAPLSDVIAEMLVTSDNNTAELLLKELGLATSGEGTRQAGLAAVTDSLGRLGVDLSGVEFSDGSGLSDANRATCGALLDAVVLARETAVAAGLPVAAETGTLVDEFLESPMAGRLRAKTGTLTGVKALSGIVDPRSGDDGATGVIEFSLVLNLENATDDDLYQTLWRALGDRFDTYPDGPTAEQLGPR